MPGANILTRIHQCFCRHRQTIRRVHGLRMFTECLRCGQLSPGVVTGIINPYSKAFQKAED